MNRTRTRSMALTAAVAALIASPLAAAQEQGADASQTMQQEEAQDARTVIESWPDTAAKAAKAMLDKYGEPDGVTDRHLTWYDNGPWVRTIVHREEIQHNFPVPHKDVLEQFVNYDVPIEKFSDLAEYDGSVVAYRTNGEMSVRCDKEAANILALNLADDIVEGNRTVDEARTHYAETIEQMMQGQQPAIVQELEFGTSMANTADPDNEYQAGSAAGTTAATAAAASGTVHDSGYEAEQTTTGEADPAITGTPRTDADDEVSVAATDPMSESGDEDASIADTDAMGESAATDESSVAVTAEDDADTASEGGYIATTPDATEGETVYEITEDDPAYAGTQDDAADGSVANDTSEDDATGQTDDQVVATPSLGQDDDGMPASDSGNEYEPAAGDASVAGTTAEQQPTAGATTDTSTPRTELTTTELVGNTVHAADGEEIGTVAEVSDVAGSEMAIIDVSSAFGVGEARLSIPVERLELSADGTVSTTLSLDELEEMQGPVNEAERSEDVFDE